MKVKTKCGNEIDLSQFVWYGEFHKYVQEHFDKNFGNEQAEDQDEYEVTFTAQKTSNVYATFTVKAVSREEAIKEAKRMAIDSECYWEEENCGTVYIENIELDDCVLQEPEENS